MTILIPQKNYGGFGQDLDMIDLKSSVLEEFKGKIKLPRIDFRYWTKYEMHKLDDFRKYLAASDATKYVVTI